MLSTDTTGMSVQERILSLLDERKPGFSLPQEFYTDPDILTFDFEAVYMRSWLLFGFEVEMPEPGSYRAMTILRTPLIVIRGQDGVLRGFFNSCRHRGAQIMPDGCGKSRRLLCPYHQWMYDDTGALRAAGKMPADFDRSQYGLRPIHVRTIAGTVYICMAENPPEFQSFHDALAPLLAPHRLQEAKVAADLTLIEKGNWKLVMENGRECYHCAARHPELSVTFPIDARAHFEADGEDHTTRFERRMQAAGIPVGPVDGGWWQAVRFPLTPGHVSMTIDGKPCVSKPMVEAEGGDVGSLRWASEPHSFAHALGDFTFMFSALPIGPEETLVVAKWLVHKDAEEGIDYTREGLIELWNATNLQDRDLVENNQRGVNSTGYLPGPYCERSEALALRFTDWYCRTISDYLQPEPRQRLQIVGG
ncbi:MAG: aromatic ring-hydroxylating dioxygenase subunit alpha [Acetobacter sp.]|uniref:aromatic ring-hydroxylating oxygenase subunit alpha n=1 Tax=Acetobacter sp. TaxID=440 RepID=UPI0039EC8E2F